MVGSITFTKKKCDHVKKGDEEVEICCIKQFGYLSFGGSTVICVFEKNSIAFDEDLIANSNRSLETLVEVEIVSGMVEVEGITNEAIIEGKNKATEDVPPVPLTPDYGGPLCCKLDGKPCMKNHVTTLCPSNLGSMRLGHDVSVKNQATRQLVSIILDKLLSSGIACLSHGPTCFSHGLTWFGHTPICLGYPRYAPRSRYLALVYFPQSRRLALAYLSRS
ncbi:hypothetical protein Lal_00039644 [Lupinus albus]|nr:hypothetical protein Lal_00039644 [Lupinus albus]